MTDQFPSLASLKDQGPDTIYLLPFGGVGEFGMNFMGYYHQNRLFIVDCGMTFADPTKLGIDVVIPSVDQWLEEFGGVHTYFMTHGHEDHIGAMPYLIKKWPAPIYATAWTAALLREKWYKHGISEDEHPITIVEPGDLIETADFSCEWVHVNHSIPMTCSLVITTPAGRIFHTGDFKFDLTPVGEEPIDLEHLASIGARGIDLLITDSTNAPSDGLSASEAVVGPALESVMRDAPGAIFLTTFASNYWRLKTIMAVCQNLGKKLFIAGSGLERTLTIAEELGLGSIPDGIYVSENELPKVPREKLVVLATGCQGEHRAALSRIIYGEHPRIKMAEGDRVIFSSRMVPGNERSVLALMSQCAKLGVEVVSARSVPDIHVSGHAFAGELSQLIDLLKPRHYMPVHGTFTQLTANMALGAGQVPGEVIGVENGQVVELASGQAQVIGSLDLERRFVDSWSRIPMDYPTLRERLKVGDSGLAILSGVYSQVKASWLAPISFEFIGLQFPDKVDLAAWRDRVSEKLRGLLQRELGAGTTAAEELNEALRVGLRRELTTLFVKKPVVIPKIHFL